MKQCIEQARTWLTEEDIIATRADKNNNVVLIPKLEYHRLLTEYTSNTKCIISDIDPTDKIRREVHRICNHPEVPPFICRCGQTYNAAPRLFGYIKCHKPALEIRPIIEKYTAPTYKLEKSLAKFIKAQIAGYPLTIISSLEFKRKFEKISPHPNDILITLDFKSLYPSLLLEPAILELRNLLCHPSTTPTEFKILLNLAHLVCKNAYYRYYGRYFTQTRGAPMGSPIAGGLAEILVRKSEETAVYSIKNTLKFYVHYIDDIFMIADSKEVASDFFARINNNPFGLTIQLEQLDKEQVYFLDMYVTKKTDSFSISIYRKPSSRISLIHERSKDAAKYKDASISTLIWQAYKLCMEEIDIVKELKVLREAYVTHGYPGSKFDNLIRKIHNKQLKMCNAVYTNVTIPNQEAPAKHFLSVPWHPVHCEVTSIFKAKHNYHFSERRNATVFQ